MKCLSCNFYLSNYGGFKNHMSKYKLIQLTNNAIGATTAQTLLPLGLITRRLNASACNCTTFQITSSDSDTLILNDPGYYKITYNANLIAAAAGDLSVSLLANQQEVTSSSETVAAADDTANITLIYTIRVCPNCCSAPTNCPVNIQLQLGDVAISAGSTANLIVEKIQ
jgi:hypothetical protein